jgi:hypothetical protein
VLIQTTIKDHELERFFIIFFSYLTALQLREIILKIVLQYLGQLLIKKKKGKEEKGRVEED